MERPPPPFPVNFEMLNHARDAATCNLHIISGVI